ncbi:MAG: NfeD family protein [Lachnospiraceae bacterium]|nr:NfeD family protein [Lachnospiraceae bacterium]
MGIMWLVILVLLILIEFATMGLTTVWFAGGALVAAVIAALNGPIWAQVAAFVVVSLLLLIFTRPIAVKYFNVDRTKTNTESLIGKQAIVTERIDNLKATGTATINGQEWTARSASQDVDIEEGAVVIIKEIQGVKLIVEQIAVEA